MDLTKEQVNLLVRCINKELCELETVRDKLTSEWNRLNKLENKEAYE